jgi:hypothetical protein
MDLTGLVAVIAPFAMVVGIIWVIQNGKIRRTELRTRGSREDDVVMGEMQTQINKLTDRVAVLERLVTDDDRRLSREIDSLRSRDRQV